MDTELKELHLANLQMALDDLDKIIDNMKKNNYNEKEINEYVKKRWNVWNEIYQAKKQ